MIYGGARGAGKTSWLINQMWKQLGLDRTLALAVVAPNQSHLDWMRRSGRVPADQYTETTFKNARGCRYDHIFIDNADLFDDPVELCRQVTPGVPVTMTYTPSERSTLAILATPPDLPKSEPTSLSQDDLLFALILAANTGVSLNAIMVALGGTFVDVDGLW